MSYVAKGEKEYDATGAPVPGAKMHKIRITLTSSNVRNLEKCLYYSILCLKNFSWHLQIVSTDLINRAKDKQLRVYGPVRLPTKVLKITTRKTVCLWELQHLHVSLICYFSFSLVVRVPKPGIAMSWRCTNVSLICTLPAKLLSRL